jgi:tRNA modification GTPase
MAEEASGSRSGRMSIDVAAEELRRGLAELGRITGRVDLDEILDVLFSDFCIGK